jgi:hypothetical protein
MLCAHGLGATFLRLIDAARCRGAVVYPLIETTQIAKFPTRRRSQTTDLVQTTGLKTKRLSYCPDMDSEEIIALFVFGVFASAIIFGIAAFVL